MNVQWTDEQVAILDHPLDEHAVVRAVPGAGKTTTLVGRVHRLLERGVRPGDVRVVMYNKSIQETFQHRLARDGVEGVKVTTFDALGLEVCRAAERRRLLSRGMEVVPDGTARWARQVYPAHREELEDAEEIARAVAFWKAHLVPPARARFPSNPALVAAYAELERLRVDGTLGIAFEDMVYTAVGLLRHHRDLLPPVRHLLVDEFQDVNPGRVELMRRLADVDTVVMVVGDEDQAINEWCGAHPRYFREFAQLFPGRPTRVHPLTRSFRFGAELAAAASRLIAFNADRSPTVVVGAADAPGRVEPVDDVAGTVARLLADGVPGEEIAVLYRGRTQGAQALAQLAARNIPLETDDLALLSRGRGPELALGYLRHAVSTAPVTFEEVWPIVFAPDRYIQKEAFQGMVARHGGRGLRAVLRARDAADFGQSRSAVRAMDDLARTLDLMGRRPTAGSALDILVSDVDVDAQLCGRLRSEKAQETAIAAFHAVHALLRGLGVAPGDAAATLATLAADRGAAPGDRVWVSTIHKAKGLEWTHVLLPGLADGSCPAVQRGSVPGTTEEPDGVAQTAWLEQERRIFYVGFTRASDVVYLEVPAKDPSPFLRELGPTTTAPKPAAAGQKWTEEQLSRIRRGWLAGEGLAALAAAVGRTPNGVAARLVRLGLVESRDEARARG